MTVSVTEGEKKYSGGTGIEITANRIVNILLRSLNNLIKLDEENHLYVDLQLEANITPEDELPVGVTTGRILQDDGWSITGTMLSYKTTSGDYVLYVYGDDGRLYIDNGTGTFKQIYLASEVDGLFEELRRQLSKVSFTGKYEDLDGAPQAYETLYLTSIEYEEIGPAVNTDNKNYFIFRTV